MYRNLPDRLIQLEGIHPKGDPVITLVVPEDAFPTTRMVKIEVVDFLHCSGGDDHRHVPVTELVDYPAGSGFQPEIRVRVPRPLPLTGRRRSSFYQLGRMDADDLPPEPQRARRHVEEEPKRVKRQARPREKMQGPFDLRVLLEDRFDAVKAYPLKSDEIVVSMRFAGNSVRKKSTCPRGKSRLPTWPDA